MGDKAKILTLVGGASLCLVIFTSIRAHMHGNQLRGIAILSKNDFSVVEGELSQFIEPMRSSDYAASVPTRLGYVPEININNDALNDRFDYPIEKPEGTFRIVGLGDSWAFGFMVSTADNYSEVLEDSLNQRCVGKKFEVINLGVPSYDTRYAAERFKIRGQKYNPDLVIWLLHRNDFTEINEFVLRVVNEAMEARRLGEIKDLDRRAQVLSEIWAEAIEKQGEEFQPADLASYQLSALRLINSYYLGRIAFFSMENTVQLESMGEGIVRKFVFERPDTYFLEKLAHLEPEELLYDNHPNAKGHREIAERLFEKLTKDKIVPCNL